MKKTKTLLFGGTFDPIHDGHLLMAETAAKALKADRVVFIPARSPRWKKTDATSRDRLNMLKIALEEYPEFEISEIELASDEDINYTFITINRYQALNPEEELAFLIGSDQANQFDQWYGAEPLSKQVQIIVYERPDDHLNQQMIETYNMQVVPGAMISASSTKIRHLHDCKTSLQVLNYISRQNLYYMPILRKYLSPERLAHSLRVARLSYEIGAANNLDYGLSYAAALLHDLGKECPQEAALAIMEQFYPVELEELKAVPDLFHQFVGEYLAKTVFKVENEEVLEAIKYHSSGAKEMSWLAKVVYAADKIEPGRTFDSSALIKACKDDYEKGFIAVLRDNRDYLEKNGINTNNKYTKECFEAYL